MAGGAQGGSDSTGGGDLQKILSQYQQASPGLAAANPQAAPATQMGQMAPWAQQMLKSPMLGQMMGPRQQMPMQRMPMAAPQRPMMGPGPIGQMLAPSGPQQTGIQQNPALGQLLLQRGLM